MGKYYLPFCFFPTSLVLIDDDKALLRNLDFSLKRNFNCHSFSDPEKALSFLQKPENNINHLNLKCFSEPEDLAPDKLSTQLDLREVHKIIYDKNRFQKSILVISDYKMPKMDGAKFSQKLKASNDIKTILLTGEADHDEAVNLFNKGIIDKFIQKSSENLLQDIVNAIEEEQRKSFIEFTKLSLNKAAQTEAEMPQCLNETKFADYFYNLCHEHSIVEYYVTDFRGGFLMLDRNANPSWLAVCTPREYEAFIDLVNTEGDAADTRVLKELTDFSSVPYFFTDEDYQTEPSKWKSFMHPVTKIIEGDMNTYYITHINNLDAYKFDTSMVSSYNDFLNNRN